MRGRPRAFKDKNLSDEYMRIFHAWFVLKWPWKEIAKVFGVSKSKIYFALAYVKENMAKIPPQALLQGSIFAIQQRVRENTRLWQQEIEKENPSIHDTCQLNGQIREDQKVLVGLELLNAENFQNEERPLSTGEVLRIITQRKVIGTSPVQQNKE